MFADIVGSTQLYDTIGDEQARALVSDCIQAMIILIESHRGKVLKTIGDEILCIFKDPDSCVSAAVALQEMMTSDSRMASHPFQLRIGLHHGPTLFEKNDVYGDTVNLASRLVDQSKANQILTTSDTLHLLGPDLRSSARLVDHTRVKGKLKMIDIHELSWGHPEERTMIGRDLHGLSVSSSVDHAQLQLSCMSRKLIVDHTCPVVTMGRDNTNTIVINDPKVSRLHAHIELRRDKFFIADKSTNGTYLYTEDSDLFLLRRDEMYLPDHGGISLGQQLEVDALQMILFQCRQSP